MIPDPRPTPSSSHDTRDRHMWEQGLEDYIKTMLTSSPLMPQSLCVLFTQYIIHGIILILLLLTLAMLFICSNLSSSIHFMSPNHLVSFITLDFIFDSISCHLWLSSRLFDKTNCCPIGHDDDPSWTAKVHCCYRSTDWIGKQKTKFYLPQR